MTSVERLARLLFALHHGYVSYEASHQAWLQVTAQEHVWWLQVAEEAMKISGLEASA